MKRLLPAFLGAIILSGCEGNPLATNHLPDSSFNAEVQISVGDEQIKGKLTRCSDNDWKLIIAEPFALEGMTVTVDENGTKLSLLGMEASADFSDSAVSTVSLISEAFDAAIKNGVTELVTNGTNENGAYTLILGEDGCPAELSIADYGITVTLSQWEEITDTNIDEAVIS